MTPAEQVALGLALEPFPALLREYVRVGANLRALLASAAIAEATNDRPRQRAYRLVLKSLREELTETTNAQPAAGRSRNKADRIGRSHPTEI